MSETSTKDKGDILEKIVEELCSGYGKTKVTRNVSVKGKTGVERQIDVLIEAEHKSFDIKIVVESKNYSRKVDIDIVEAFNTKLRDVSGNLGVIVCPLGFTSGATSAAAMYDIQLFQVFDHSLKNTTNFIPLRYIVPSPGPYQIRIEHGALGGQFSLPADVSKWRITIKEHVYSPEDAVIYAWNQNMIAKEAGEQIADFGVVKIANIDDLKIFYYLELKISIIVSEDYYLKLFPESYMKNTSSGKGNHKLKIDAYSKKEDMIKNGWKNFNTREEMEAAAKPYDLSSDIHSLSMTEDSTFG